MGFLRRNLINMTFLRKRRPSIGLLGKEPRKLKGKVTIALFKSERCGWSKRFKDVWEKLKKELIMENIDLEFVEYDSDKDKEMFLKYNIQGYPNTYIMVQVGENLKTRDYNVLRGYFPLHNENGREGALNRCKNMITKILNFSDLEWNQFLQKEKDEEALKLKQSKIWSKDIIMKYLNQDDVKKLFLEFAEKEIENMN